MSGSTIFTYGTLCIPEVMNKVSGNAFPTKKATLDGYLCCLIKDEIYPAIVPSTGNTVHGVVHFDIDSISLERLDYFEDIIYDRESLRVELENHDVIDAYAYVLKESKCSLLSTEPWDEIYFREQYLARYLERF